jgi:adenylate cyclase
MTSSPSCLVAVHCSSSFTYRGQPVDLKQVARELGVRYLLEGSVRRDVGRVRINAQLIDAEAGSHIWAERYDREIERVFAVQDDIALAVVTAIQPVVADAEFRRTLRKPPESLGAWELYQRGLWHMGKANPTDNDQAKEFFQRAITLDAMFAPAYAAMAMTCMHAGLVFATISLQEAAKLTTGWARKAVEIDANDADTQAILAWTIAVGAPTAPAMRVWMACRSLFQSTRAHREQIPYREPSCSSVASLIRPATRY